MSLGQKIEAVRAAEVDVVLEHQRLLEHVHEFREARERLVTPGRIVGTGLALGFIAGKAIPALRDPQVKQDVQNGADMLQRVSRLATAAMPLLMPLIARMQAGSNDGHAAPSATDGHCA